MQNPTRSCVVSSKAVPCATAAVNTNAALLLLPQKIKQIAGEAVQ
jgi:hypothetical protein